MANIKVELKKGETIRSVEELMFKALEAQRTGDVHTEKFEDPAMDDLVMKMAEAHKDMYQELLEEIFRELDAEYGSEYDNF
jgi:hypothetical protein